MTEENCREYLFAVGARLRAARLLKGCTQKKAAEDVGMTQSFLSAVERGKKSACTAQIISLIRYYGVSYEMIFGSIEDVEGPVRSSFWSEQADMLTEMASGSPAAAEGVNNCLKICAYMLLRTIYRENPRSSERIFSVEYEKAMESCAKIISCAPENLSRFIRRSRDTDPKRFELPVEKASELRAFIKECEEMLSVG